MATSNTPHRSDADPLVAATRIHVPTSRSTTRRMARWSAALTVTALLAASCAADDEPAAAPATPAAETTSTSEAMAGMSEGETGTEHGEGHMMATEAIASPASDLRAGLTSLLQEHVYLAGAALSQAVKDGGNLEAPGTASAVATLDTNSVALSEAVSSVYGPAAGEQFLALWREHIGFFVDYTLGGATADTARQDMARQDLEAYGTEFGAFLDGATEGQLPTDAVAAELKTHVASLLTTIDSLLAGSTDVYPNLAEAAGHMPMTAATLAGGIATHQQLEGDVTSPAVGLRAGLTHLLQEHVYLAGLGINQAVADGGNLDAPATVSAVGALDANSVALSEAVASVYGEPAGEQFLALWREHIGFFVEYTLGGATGDTARQQAAGQSLDNYRAEFGAFLDSATEGGLPADAVAADLQVHVNTLVAAVDAILAGSPEVYPKLREAAQHMPMTADTLATAIVTHMPEAFES